MLLGSDVPGCEIKVDNALALSMWLAELTGILWPVWLPEGGLEEEEEEEGGCRAVAAVGMITALLLVVALTFATEVALGIVLDVLLLSLLLPLPLLSWAGCCTSLLLSMLLFGGGAAVVLSDIALFSDELAVFRRSRKLALLCNRGSVN